MFDWQVRRRLNWPYSEAVFRYLLVLTLVLCSIVPSLDAWESPCVAADDDLGFVDFDHTVLPILTKAGCNSGACHGAAIGRGGFQLSLFGQNPAKDFDRIARELAGRRINVVEPENSLLLRKGGELMDHGGGERLVPDSKAWNQLRDWIGQGARRGVSGELQKTLSEIIVTPSRIRLASLDSPAVAIQVMAKYSDGSTSDMTELATLIPHDPMAVAIDNAAMSIEPRRVGRQVVLVRVRDKIGAIEVLVALHENEASSAEEIATGDADESQSPFADEATSPQLIDPFVFRQLEELGLQALPQVDDLSFLRRVTIDLCGRVPTEEEIVAYQAAPNGVRRAAAIDRLLASEDAIEYWTDRWMEILQAKLSGDPMASDSSQQPYRQHIRAALATGRPVPDILTDLVLASGSIEENGAVGFYLTAKDGRSQAELFSEVMMGVRLRCANCHDHPFDHWTQDDYHGLAALFAGIRRTPRVDWHAGATNIHPVTGEPAQGQTLDHHPLRPDQDPRPAIAEYIQRQTDWSISRAWVNRAWFMMMGRGLIEPVDDLRDTNPASHPELLDALIVDWREHGYDWLHLLRSIANSHAYGRAVQNEKETTDLATQAVLLEMYAAREPRSMPNDVLRRSIKQITDADIALQHLSVDQESLAGKLEWIVGPMLNQSIADPQGQVRRWQSDTQSDPRSLVQSIYLRCLNRVPVQSEQQFWIQQLQANSKRDEIIEDMVWSLLTCREFITNH